MKAQVVQWDSEFRDYHPLLGNTITSAAIRAFWIPEFNLLVCLYANEVAYFLRTLQEDGKTSFEPSDLIYWKDHLPVKGFEVVGETEILDGLVKSGVEVARRVSITRRTNGEFRELILGPAHEGFKRFVV